MRLKRATELDIPQFALSEQLLVLWGDISHHNSLNTL